ncbi:MAG TPA: GNAT family N-acetyltransferase [Actinocatenispora sp.]
MTVRLGAAADHDAAVRVWLRANEARGRVPSAARVARIRAKLGDPVATLLVATDDDVVGMALTEPGRADDGAGEPLPELCHLAMVFVDPGRQGVGVGGLLVAAVRAFAVHCGHSRIDVWTGAENERAQRLYRGAGFVPTGRTGTLANGLRTVQLLLRLT